MQIKNIVLYFNYVEMYSCSVIFNYANIDATALFLWLIAIL